jgi:hypothetical protein
MARSFACLAWLVARREMVHCRYNRNSRKVFSVGVAVNAVAGAHWRARPQIPSPAVT